MVKHIDTLRHQLAQVLVDVGEQVIGSPVSVAKGSVWTM